ncbi:unnamed protein product [Rhizoctonia solani]|uniref:Uncharacterized protein n=1 Tax=Rhizoctonia solani TaxID=456999 RepID=A0A8H3BHV5_9AGAM|nr:unnamed protein product [Rhizoctonia solani]
MATAVGVRRRFFDINLRRRPFLEPAVLVATSAVNIVDAPGLRQPARAARGIVAALQPDIFQAPKHINAQAQKQIDRIVETITSISPGLEKIGREVQDPTDIRIEYLIGAQAFIDKLEKLKAKLVNMKAMGCKRRFFYQGGIIQDLDEYDQLFWEARGEFSLFAANQANQANQVVSGAPSPEGVQVPSAWQAVVVQFKNNFQFIGVIQLREYQIPSPFFFDHGVPPSASRYVLD